MATLTTESWICRTCAYIYDEAAGDSANGLLPGTRWADVPEDWPCPDCGTHKHAFDRAGEAGP